MSNLDTEHLLKLASQLVDLSLASGVDVAEASARQGWELSSKVRLGETELVQESGHHSVALRLIRGNRVATTSTSDVTDEGLRLCVRDAVELLDLTEPDPWAGPADPALLARTTGPDLDLFDPAIDSIDADQAIAIARQAEAAALGFDARLTLSEGASFSRVSGASALVLSSGFRGVTRGSYASLSVSPVVIDGQDKRRRGSYWTARRHLADLEDPQAVGHEAARRTLRQLGPQKVSSCEVPVIFDQDSARSIVGTFAGCILGGAIWRKSSYLADRVGSAVASPLVTFTDDPLMPRGPGSRTFDGEGVPTRVNVVVKDGILETFLLDSYSARKLGLATTASASRAGASVSASASNFIMTKGTLTPEQIIAQTPRGLLVTEMMGFGFNGVTGDFSRGAAGFWIENGVLTHPVSEITISSNLNEMLLGIDAVADDLDTKTSIAAPTFRVRSMTISGT
jgi:PmbA protein